MKISIQEKLTTLKKQLDEIDTQFDYFEAKLDEQRKNAKEMAWKLNIESGLLKSELNNPF